jgi:hypothetical protein
MAQIQSQRSSFNVDSDLDEAQQLLGSSLERQPTVHSWNALSKVRQFLRFNIITCLVNGTSNGALL